jgi:hypothetical protein
MHVRLRVSTPASTVTLEPPAHRQQISRAVLALARHARASASL